MSGPPVWPASSRRWGEDPEKVAGRVGEVGEGGSAWAWVEVLADHGATELLRVGAGALDVRDEAFGFLYINP